MTENEALTELKPREPIFHRPAYARTSDDFARMMAEGYWEVGASGKIYSRDFILEHLARLPPADSDVAGWTTSDFACKEVGADTFLATYILGQGKRLSRRATLWRYDGVNWQILYHQGTVVQP